MPRARDCLEEIMGLHESGQSENGADILDRITDLYFLTLDQHSPADRDTFGDVMGRLAFDGDALTRARLAERIAQTDGIPYELIRRLARDEICVARPILQYSPCLREGDLVSIAAQVEQSHLMATAHRHELSVPVTDILVQRGQKSVLHAVARNSGAELSPRSMERLVEQAQGDELIHRALKARRGIAPKPIERLKRLAETDFWQNMAESLLMSPDEKAGPEVTPQAARSPRTPSAGDEEKKEPPKAHKELELKPANPAAEKFLVESVKSGDVDKSVESFSKITLLDENMIEHCLFQAHVSALMVLCKAHRLAPSTFTSLLHLREIRTGEPVNDTVSLVRRYESMTPDTAQRIIRFSNKRRSIDETQDEPQDDKQEG